MNRVKESIYISKETANKARILSDLLDVSVSHLYRILINSSLEEYEKILNKNA